ncbi:MAG: transcriptional repressor LexA [Clostridia bacterium]|nr:transcriptional repressor LexA [Clostridia bacterium]MBP3554818.1 transcriptional repressor LexA [Clostridia bacterium]MBQ8419987.1 transcriptional repressor LexA [Clostridia bacterium]
MQTLTEKEREMYQYICKVMEEKGYAPSVRDIQNALSIKSTATVHSYLNKLEDKGYIQKEQGKSRTLRVGADTPAPQGTVRVPIVGQVAAGLPILAEQNYDGYVDFCPPRGLSRAELFALRIKGESMIEAGIMNGDYVIVSRTSYVENGDIAVVLLDDEATVKTFYRENGAFRLQPENRTMKPIITKEVYILGKVIANIRYYH